MLRLIGILFGAARLVLVAGVAAAGVPGSEAAPDAAGTPTLTIEIDGDSVTGRGMLPDGFPAAALREHLPGVRLPDGLGSREGGDPEAWHHALGALGVVLPRLSQAWVTLCGRSFSLTGRLRDGFARRETLAALRAALGQEWTLDASLDETPPPPMVEIVIADGRLRLTGILPHGLPVAMAQSTAGTAARDSALATGARGDSADWTRALAIAGRAARLFTAATGRIEDGRLGLSGRLAPGQEAEPIRNWASAALGAGWEVEIAGEPTPAEPGERRVVPATGGTERLILGHWLLEPAFAPERGPCTAAMDSARSGQRIAFVSGRAEPVPDAERVLDRLAGIALHCLRGFGARLEIGGHTDSRGDAEANLALSRARAKVVRDALRARGVPLAATRAVGYGDARPLADNDTEKGRRKNRRISFEWIGD